LRRAAVALPGEQKQSFFRAREVSEIIRSRQFDATKVILFLFGPLTSKAGQQNYFIRSGFDRVAGFDGAACAAKKC
jgi:hypothetical protein